MTVLNATTITAVTPAHSAGQVDVVIELTGANPARLTKGFNYLKKTTKNAQPASASVAGGTTVTVSGDGFDANTIVTFDGVQASMVSLTETTMVVTAPPHESGSVDLVVSDKSGSDGAPALPFTYVSEDPAIDTDGDGLPDAWENAFGLDPADATGDNGAAGDPDHDDVTNEAGTRERRHPPARPC